MMEEYIITGNDGYAFIILGIIAIYQLCKCIYTCNKYLWKGFKERPTETFLQFLKELANLPPK